MKEFLLEHNIYLIDCAVSHFTVNSLGNIINLTNSNDIGFDKKGDLDFLPLKPYVNTNSVANILVFHERIALPEAHIKYDGSKEDAIFWYLKAVE